MTVARASLVVALGALAACAITTDFDGLVGSVEDAGSGPSVIDSGGPPPVCAASVDLDDDPKNCGTCGHDCLGGECERGKCAPVLLTEDLYHPSSLGLTSIGLYIGSDDGLFLLPTGQTQRIEIDSDRVNFVYPTATHLFWTNAQDNTVRALPIGDTNSARLKDSIESITGIVVSRDFIFFSRGDQDLIQRMPFTTTATLDVPLEDVNTTTMDPQGLELVGDKLYVAAYADDRVFEIGDQGKGEPRALSFRECDPHAVKIDGPDAFVTCTQGGSVRRAPVDGSRAEEILVDRLDSPGGLWVAPDAIYYTERDSGKVWRVAR